MTQDNNTEVIDTEDESGSTEDSSVIQALRQQLKDAKKELSSQPKRSDLEAGIRAQVRREAAIEGALVSLGHPAGIRSIIEEQLGDAEATRESVAAALTAIGYTVTADAPDGGGRVESQSNLQQVTALSSQVQSAAQQGGNDDFYDKLNKTTNKADIARLMAEEGLTSGGSAS